MTQETQIQPTAVAYSESATNQPSDSDFNKLLAKEKSLELSCFDNKVFDQLHKVAQVLANSSLIPDSFKGDKNGEYPLEKVTSNCFLVVEQAHRWGMSPFAVIGSASVVHGKLMWEGKLVHAVLESKLGVRLSYEFNNKSGDGLGVVVTGTLPGESEPRTIDGTVGGWKTTGNNSPWSRSSAHKRQLRYMGSREWARAHAPGVMLGIITTDEAQDFGSKPLTSVVREKPVIPFGEEKPEGLPEQSDLVNEATLKKINQAWEALGKPKSDIVKACKHVGSDAANLMSLNQGEGEKLLKILQKQMNGQAGKTNGQIEAEKAKAKPAEPAEELDLEGSIL